MTSKTNRNLVMFRMREKHLSMLKELLKRDPIMGVDSVNQFGKKVVIDYLEGRLEYRNPADRDRASDLLDACTSSH